MRAAPASAISGDHQAELLRAAWRANQKPMTKALIGRKTEIQDLPDPGTAAEAKARLAAAGSTSWRQR